MECVEKWKTMLLHRKKSTHLNERVARGIVDDEREREAIALGHGAQRVNHLLHFARHVGVVDLYGMRVQSVACACAMMMRMTKWKDIGRQGRGVARRRRCKNGKAEQRKLDASHYNFTG